MILRRHQDATCSISDLDLIFGQTSQGSHPLPQRLHLHQPCLQLTQFAGHHIQIFFQVPLLICPLFAGNHFYNGRDDGPTLACTINKQGVIGQQGCGDQNQHRGNDHPEELPTAQLNGTLFRQPRIRDNQVQLTLPNYSHTDEAQNTSSSQVDTRCRP